MPAICVDIDNVIAQTDKVMRKVIRDCSGNHVDLAYDDIVCFNYWLCRDTYGRRFDKSEWRKIHEEFTRAHLLRILPFDNVKDHLKCIGEKFDVHLATSRLVEGQEQTLVWLSQHQIPYCELHYVRQGEKHLINHHFVAAIDDDREQGYAFNYRGVRTFILAHPWNHISPYSPLRRVANWEELTREILNLTV